MQKNTMTSETIKNTAVCRENGDEFYEKWFSQRKQQQFISHVDTLYYTVFPTLDDWNKDDNKLALTGFIRKIKDKAELIREPIQIFENIADGLEVQPFFGARMYSLHFGKKDCFDIFLCESIPNIKTPPIMVQLRSQSLWLDGMKQAFDNSCKIVEMVLNMYHIQIEKVKENRIDYAFHTNYINDYTNFFPEKELKEMQISNFERWHKEGNFYNSEVLCDYFTLGRRKSKNVFFRVYNKTKEVIEQGYKQFFIEIWKKYGLISEFDRWVLERAFISGSYESKDKARCEFYYDYGKDEEIRKEIGDKLKYPDTPMSWYSKNAKKLVPDITVITNVELQTMRKFYDRIENSIPFVTKNETYKKHIYNLIEQMSEIIRFLTQETIRFVKYKGEYANTKREERPNAEWWDKLRAAKYVEIPEFWIIDYIRSYQKKLDIERQSNLTLHKSARMGAYNEFVNGEEQLPDSVKPENAHSYMMIKDFQNFYESLNDNDIKKYYRIKKRKLEELKSQFEE